MSSHRVVVDGSNIATEGRSLPSLQQLDEAVRAYRDEHPDAEVIVVVDATFAHRIDESERSLFEEAAAHNELVYPPAGAIGRGDAFLLRIADKTDAVVLSNDSFQEFHGEFEWLFTKGRLMGGTPVPGVGWIFVPRTPVRGPKSREAVKEAKRGKARIGSKEASVPMPVPKAPPPRAPKNKDAKGGDSPRPSKSGQPKGGGRLKAAIEEATEEAVSVEEAVGGGGGGGGGKRKRRRRKGKGGGGGNGDLANLPTVNEPLTFIQFIADHQPGASVEGEIESFASHGAFVLVGDARCYIPLSAMGDPPPRSAREVLNRGETRTFVVQALDAPRRGIELALPGFEQVAGQPTDETVEAEIEEAPTPISAKRGGRGGRGGGRGRKSPAGDEVVAMSDFGADAIPIVPEAPQERPLELPAKRTSTKKAGAKKAAAKQATVEKSATPTAKKTAKKATAKKATAKKATAKKATAKKASAPEQATAPTNKASTKKAAAAAKKATAKKPAAAAKATPAKRPVAATKTAAKTSTAAEKSTAKKATTKKAATPGTGAAKKAAKKAPASKAVAKTSTAKKAPAKKPPGKKGAKKAAS